MACPNGGEPAAAFAAESSKAPLPPGEHPLPGIAAPCAVFTLPEA